MKYLLSGLKNTTTQQFYYGKLLLLTLVFSFTFAACGEQEAIVPIDANAVGLTDEVFENLFVEDLTYVLEVMEKDEEEDNYSVLQISKEDGALRINSVTVYGPGGDFPLKSIGGPLGPDGDERTVYAGTGKVKFARCADKWLDNHPGECLSISRDSSGNNTADETDC